MARSSRTTILPRSVEDVFERLDRPEYLATLVFDQVMDVEPAGDVDESWVVAFQSGETSDSARLTRLEREPSRRVLYALEPATAPPRFNFAFRRRVGFELEPAASGARVTVSEEMTTGLAYKAVSFGLGLVVPKLVTFLNARRLEQALQRAFAS